MRVGSALLVAVCAVAVGSCTPTYEIRPAMGGAIAVRSLGGINIVADPNAWDARPYDLPNYMTPIAVRITNNSGQDLRVAYADFALTNDQGFRYSAVNPYGLMGQQPVGERVTGADGQRLVASSDGEARFTPAAHVDVVPGRRFFVYPRTHYAYRYYDPWPYGYVEPPYYGPYVTLWNPSYYPANPTEDIQRMGLPQGVVRNGGQISGFVYFQNAGQRSSHLNLTWSAHTPEGRTVAVLQVPFVVVRR